MMFRCRRRVRSVRGRLPAPRLVDDGPQVIVSILARVRVPGEGTGSGFRSGVGSYERRLGGTGSGGSSSVLV